MKMTVAWFSVKDFEEAKYRASWVDNNDFVLCDFAAKISDHVGAEGEPGSCRGLSGLLTAIERNKGNSGSTEIRACAVPRGPQDCSSYKLCCALARQASAESAKSRAQGPHGFSVRRISSRVEGKPCPDHNICRPDRGQFSPRLVAVSCTSGVLFGPSAVSRDRPSHPLDIQAGVSRA